MRVFGRELAIAVLVTIVLAPATAILAVIAFWRALQAGDTAAVILGGALFVSMVTAGLLLAYIGIAQRATPAVPTPSQTPAVDPAPPKPERPPEPMRFVAVRDRIEVRKIHDAVELFDNEGARMYSVIQVWFINVDPIETVRELSAEVGVLSVYHTGMGDEWHRAFTRWAIGAKPENVGGWTDVRTKIDLEPKAIGKLNVFRRYPDARADDPSAYFFADDGTKRLREYEFNSDDLHVQIHLRAVGYERLFSFRLLNGATFELLPHD